MQYPYSGSDDEVPEQNLAGGGPSSILHAPGENTLRKNFQAIQERNEAIAAQQELQAQRAAAAEAAANGRHGIMPPPRDPDKRDKRGRKEDANLPEVPPSRPPLPHRLDQQPGGAVTPPHPPPQRPLPPPPGQSEPLRRDDGRKPSTPPSREHRNSRIGMQPPQQQRKPEELDVLAAQLNELASSPRNGRQAQQRQRQSGAGQDRNNGHPGHQRPIVEDDSSDDDEDAVLQRDGTLQVNDPVSRPLRELGGGPGGAQARKGPGRPLPPTPDDDNSDSMRRASQGHRMEAAQARGGVMPDLLPQQSSGGSGPNTPVSRMTGDEGARIAAGMQEKQKSFLGFGFGEGGPGQPGTPPTGGAGDGASPGGARRQDIFDLFP